MEKFFSAIRDNNSPIDRVVLDIDALTIELWEGEKRTACTFKFTGEAFPSGTNENPKWEQHAIFQKEDEEYFLEIVWDYMENEDPDLTADWDNPRALKIDANLFLAD